MTDLELAFKALSGKADAYQKLFQYYEGDQPTVYTTKRLEEIFKAVDARFTENWCAVVIDSVKDRINLASVLVPEMAQERWVSLWEESELKLESDDAHKDALITGESFIIAWPDQDGVPQAFYNDPRLVHVFYEANNPRIKRFAAKWWKENDKETRLTLYYPDRLEYYAASGKEMPSSADAFRIIQDAERNPTGEVPVFHFRAAGRRIVSDLQNVVPIQNGINKLMADLMVTSEYMAFPQRYIISNADIKGKVKNAPNEIMDLPAGDGMGQQTQAGQFAAAELENYLKSINDLSMAISSITRTPKHYFFSIGSNLSGEALIAMESPLNKKAQDRIDRFVPVWKDLTRYMLKLAGIEIKKQDVRPVFDRTESVQPFTEAQAIQMYVSSGVALQTAQRRLGWTEEEIEKAEEDRQAEAARQELSLAQGLLEAQRRFDRGNEIG